MKARLVHGTSSLRIHEWSPLREHKWVILAERRRIAAIRFQVGSLRAGVKRFVQLSLTRS